MLQSKIVTSLFALLVLFGCRTLPHTKTIEQKRPLWQHTEPEAAFAEAKREQKPLLIYWGAQWCPPCHDLKNNLFSTTEFAELVAPTVTLSLDGDSEVAQQYADKLKVSGYPTLLLLASDGTEVIRIMEPLSIEEFQSLFKSALLKLRSEKARIDAVLSEMGSDDDFRVLSLADTSDGTVHDESLFKKIANKVPARLTRERSLLLLKALGYAMEKEDKDKKTESKEWAIVPLQNLLGDETHPLPTFFSFRAKDTKEWLGKKLFEKRLEKLWLKRMAQERADINRSITSRLWSYLPEIELASQMSADRKTHLQNEIIALLEQAKNDHDRHSATSAVGTLLPMLGNTALARSLLEKALQNPKEKTPWYFEASLAQLESEGGHLEAALKWSERSKKSAKGSATSIQWSAMNILMNLKHRNGAHEHISALLRDFYQDMFATKDGFLGRNRLYAKKVAKALQPERAHYQGTITKFSERCESLGDESKGLCREYFKQLNAS